jgi:hypothetical protein
LKGSVGKTLALIAQKGGVGKNIAVNLAICRRSTNGSSSKRAPSSGQIDAGTSYPPTVIAFQKLRVDLRTSQQEMLLEALRDFVAKHETASAFQKARG